MKKNKLKQYLKKVFDIQELFGECRAVDYLSERVKKNDISREECRYLLTCLLNRWHQCC